MSLVKVTPFTHPPPSPEKNKGERQFARQNKATSSIFAVYSDQNRNTAPTELFSRVRRHGNRRSRQKKEATLFASHAEAPPSPPPFYRSEWEDLSRRNWQDFVLRWEAEGMTVCCELGWNQKGFLGHHVGGGDTWNTLWLDYLRPINSSFTTSSVPKLSRSNNAKYLLKLPLQIPPKPYKNYLLKYSEKCIKLPLNAEIPLGIPMTCEEIGAPAQVLEWRLQLSLILTSERRYSCGVILSLYKIESG